MKFESLVYFTNTLETVSPCDNDPAAGGPTSDNISHQRPFKVFADAVGSGLDFFHAFLTQINEIIGPIDDSFRVLEAA